MRIWVRPHSLVSGSQRQMQPPDQINIVKMGLRAFPPRARGLWTYAVRVGYFPPHTVTPLFLKKALDLY
jgi:hypothetical protein